jgi:hypothetical protein
LFAIDSSRFSLHGLFAPALQGDFDRHNFDLLQDSFQSTLWVNLPGFARPE